MKLQKLRLTAFRNISEAEIEFHSDLNFIVGFNGQGKTSILEGIKFLSSLESFRTTQSKDLIQYGKVNSNIEGDLTHSEGSTLWSETLRATIGTTPSGRSTIGVSINGKSAKSKIQYLKELSSPSRLGFYAISFNPADHEIIEGDPKIRRTYLNHAIAAENLEYWVLLKNFTSLVDQRNKLLKQQDQYQSIDEDLLNSFTAPLLRLSAEITGYRVHWLNRMIPVLNRKLGEISGNKQLPVFIEMTLGGIDHEKLALYGTPVSWNNADYQNRLNAVLIKKRSAELRICSTLVGAHRDQWNFRTDFAALKGRASQGEVRSVLLSLKLAEIENYQITTRIKPVLLLDDFSSELDLERRQFLLSYLQSLRLQAFVTTTENLTGVRSGFKVREGKIQPEDLGIF
ncbi:MAG: DNA replication and repair protein RecF [Xanthomonadaceae bacterium]|nr:DNA replication and repair protein RecF [Xanthomonadaceae bacterium]